MSQTATSAATTPQIPGLFGLALLSALSILSLNMFLPAQVDIAVQFGVSYGAVSWALTLYLVLSAVLMLLLGPLSDRYGRRPVVLGIALIFTLASALAALAPTFAVFCIGRALQAAIVSGYALSVAIIRDRSDQSEAARRIAYLTVAMALAPILGPVIGGAMAESFGWRVIFWGYTAIGALLIALMWVDLSETRDQSRPQQGWAERRQLMGSRLFWGFALCPAFGTGVFYAFVAAAPLVADIRFGSSTTVIGVLVGIITVGFSAGAFLGARLTRRFGLRDMMIAGTAITTAGPVIGLVLLVLGALTPISYGAMAAISGFGNGISKPASHAGGVSVNPELAGLAAGLTGALTVAVGAVVTLVLGAFLAAGGGVVAQLALMLAAGLAALATALSVEGDGRA